MKTLSSLVVPMAVLWVTWAQGVLGFVPTAGLVSNTTKNRLMMPLRVDNALGLVARDEDNGITPPRGIVLNAGVGGLTFAGGLMGFITKGSKASLIAGSTFGGLMLLSASLISAKNKKGNTLGSVVGGMLCYVMGKKFLISKKFMPAGLIAFLGGLSFVYNLIEALSNKSTSSSDDD